MTTRIALAVCCLVALAACHILGKDVTCDVDNECPSELASCDLTTHRCVAVAQLGEGEGAASEGEGAASEGEGEGAGEGEGSEGEGAGEGEGSEGEGAGEGEGSEGEGAGEGEGTAGEGEGTAGEGEGEGTVFCNSDSECAPSTGTGSLCIDAACVAAPSSTCTGGAIAVLTFGPSGPQQVCMTQSTLPFPADACASGQIPVFVPAVPGGSVDVFGLCLPLANGEPLARCSNFPCFDSAQCPSGETCQGGDGFLAPGACSSANPCITGSCEAVLPAPQGSTSLFRRRWHTSNFSGDTDALFICATECNGAPPSGEMCLTAIGRPAVASPAGDDANAPSGGILAPSSFVANVGGQICNGITVPFDGADIGHPNFHCPPSNVPAFAVGNVLVAAPGYLAPFDTSASPAACFNPGVATPANRPSSTLATLGWAFVCAQAREPQSTTFSCGLAGRSLGSTDFTCAFPAGFTSGAQSAAVFGPLATQCASGAANAGGTCIGRALGGTCIEGSVCDPTVGGCDPQGRGYRRCGQLNLLGQTPPGEVSSQCESNDFNGSICLGANGDSEGALNQCASEALDATGTQCGPSAAGLPCGRDNDCASGTLCLASRGVCVVTGNTSAVPADCASGASDGTACVAGGRGDDCVGVGSGTCAAGLACLDQVCR